MLKFGILIQGPPGWVEHSALAGFAVSNGISLKADWKIFPVVWWSWWRSFPSLSCSMCKIKSGTWSDSVRLEICLKNLCLPEPWGVLHAQAKSLLLQYPKEVTEEWPGQFGKAHHMHFTCMRKDILKEMLKGSPIPNQIRKCNREKYLCPWILKNVL